MLKRFVVCVMMLALLAVPCFAGDNSPGVSAQSAVVLNRETLEVVYEKNARQQMSMASTTKIMTSIIALEDGNPQQVVQMTPEMVNVEGTSMGLKDGDFATLETLVAGMLLVSGNDAANAVAYALGGSMEGFAEMMNRKAAQIGMQNSHFVTPSGLDEEEHYTTAYDMALLGAYALKNSAFRAICSAKSMEVSFGNPASKQTLRNHNKMLSLYEGAIGIKTGFTKKSGRCLVAAAQRGGVELVTVTLNASDDWDDTASMLDYGFSQTKLVELDAGARSFTADVIGGEMPQLALELAFPVQYSCVNEASLQITQKTFLSPFLYAPIKQGDIVGYSCYYNKDQLISRVPIVAAQSVEALPVSPQPEKKTLWEKIKNLFNQIKEFFNHGESN